MHKWRKKIKEKITLLKLNTRSFGLFLSGCLADVPNYLSSLNDYVLSDVYTSDCNLYGKSVSLDYHHTSIATFTTSWQSGAFSRNCSYSFFCPSPAHHLFVLFITLLGCLWENFPDPALLRFLRPNFLSFQCIFVKQQEQRNSSYFTQSVMYTCRLYTESLIGSQAT